MDPSGIPEEPIPGSPEAAVVGLALAKARAVALRILSARPSTPAPTGAASTVADATVVLGADTEVVLDGALLGKPGDATDAVRMLRRLRGRAHEVITGLALVEAGGQGREATAAVISRVTMADYADGEIHAYVATGEPFDKAGGYAVQGLGGRLVAHIDGCYTNVVGLPVTTTRRLLEAWGVV